jgi:hypothetical protein
MSNKTIFFHIGFHKTGTSYLQQIFSKNSNILQQNNILYYQDPIYPGKGLNNHTLALCLRKQPHPTIDFRESPGSVWARFLKTVHDVRQNNILVSSEVFMEDIDKTILRGELTGQNPIFIIYLREPVQWFESMYAEELKHGYNRGPEQYFTEEKDRTLDFHRQITSWINIFGKNSIRIRDYQKAVERGGLLSDVLTIVGGGPALAAQISLPTDNVNPRIPQTIAEILVRYNQLPVTDKEKLSFRNQLLKLIRENRKVAELPRFTVGNRVRNKVRKRFSRAYKKTLQEFTL